MARTSREIIEQQLVSLAGTLFYLNKIGSTLDRKPLVPRHMESLMGTVSVELEQLNTQFARSKEEVHQVAIPILLQWLTEQGWSLNGPVSAVLDHKGTVTRVEGRLQSLNVCGHLVDSWRAVELVLAPMTLSAVSSKTGAPVSKVSDVGDYTVHCIFRDAVVQDVPGIELPAIRVRVPIQERVQKKVASYFLGATVIYGC